ncbi:nucleotide pyrophosphohydrolase [Undibacterium danionis]|uniref:Nucleotide pyrophosphohydrolase n=1 Tax=Undibacterium danionis TaxID=1812100 RepID=A0ABV6IBD2_9BURK
MHDQISDLLRLREQLRSFVAEREWQQFHTPKNLASALAVEAAELLEPFQWLQNGELAELNDATQIAVRHEMADVLNYLVMLADRLNVDLIAAAQEKIALNAQKYPVDQARGSIKKYTELRQQISVEAISHTANHDAAPDTNKNA